MSHTKGKWKVNEDASGDVFISGPNGEYIAEIGNPDEGADFDAKRIVDCVNACDGMDMDSPADEIARLCSQRDAARDELNRLADAFIFFIEDGERPSEWVLAEWEFKAKKACE